MMERFDRAQLNFFKYNFKSPLKFKDHTLSEKEGYFLNLFDQRKKRGIGELSPLKGFSKKDLPQLKIELEKNLFYIIDTPFKVDDIDFKKPFFNLFKAPTVINSNVLFCIEGAILSWLETTHAKLLQNFFKLKNFNFAVPLNGLLIGEEKDLDKTIEEWNSAGLTSIKVKIGRKSIKEELALIWNIYKKSHGKITLRLDANQNFDSEDFRFFAKNLPLKIIDYIEDPIPNFHQLDQAITGLKIPIAIDENILEHKDRITPFVKTWVIKPSLVGGYSKAVELIEEAAKRKIKTVISSSFETNLSLKYLALLAKHQNDFAETPCGLDTFRYFIDDKSDTQPYIKEGNIHF
ncbi:MAG: hypothetical protein DRQ88_08640 [Epsilonproteobacteria bacterium]|nr:MAG: hypothetical protein DRQ88_08640 [Campylobacterota bacterium]